jgi:hypothetical protein
MSSLNAIMDGETYGTELPETRLDDASAKQARRVARFARTSEFKELKAHLESRIAFYQTYLPDGTPLVTVKNLQERQDMWIVANAIIGEFKAVLSAYEQAAEAASAAPTAE